MKARARKKYEFYGKGSIQDSQLAVTYHQHPHNQQHQHHQNQRPSQQHRPFEYSDYSQAETIHGIMIPHYGKALLRPMECDAGPKPKYPCIGFESFLIPSCSTAQQDQRNLIYSMPVETSAPSQRSLSREECTSRSSRSENDKNHRISDETEARALSVPISISDITNPLTDELNKRLSKCYLSETQLSLIQDIRRRAKNRVAVQNCRKRKLDHLNALPYKARMTSPQKLSSLSHNEYLTQETARIREKLNQLYYHILLSLTNASGKPINHTNWNLQLLDDGNLVLVLRSAN